MQVLFSRCLSFTCFYSFFFFFFKQKTAYEMRISDWSSDVCSSDLCSRTLHGFQIAVTDRLVAVLRGVQHHVRSIVPSCEERSVGTVAMAQERPRNASS